ncbi:MAG: hypothetical protein NT062_09025 [Proteobacteria bacterium]|nr:hypothetical protein [Pseudomonadota bacterium]
MMPSATWSRLACLGALVATGCGEEALSAEEVAQRDGLVEGKGWSYVGYAPPVGRESHERILDGVAIVDSKARVLWSAKVQTQQAEFTDVLLGEFGSYFNELPLAMLGINTPALERGRMAMMAGNMPRQAIWSDETPTQITSHRRAR